MEKLNGLIKKRLIDFGLNVIISYFDSECIDIAQKKSLTKNLERMRLSRS